MTHGQADEADQIVSDIEQKVDDEHGDRCPSRKEPIEVRQRDSIGFGPIVKAVFGEYKRRSLLGFMLMVSQAFFYNAIFFTYALVLDELLRGQPSSIGYYILPFAAGNFLGPLLLGRLFDVVGRKIMISSTYIIAGTGLIIVGYLFQQNSISATQLTVGWTVDLLFRVGRSQRRLPHGQRSLPDGDACDGDRVLLRHRDRDRRNHRARALRPQYRHRKPHDRLLRLPAWSGPYDPGRNRGDLPRSQRGTTITRRRRRTAHRRIVTTVVRRAETGDTGAGQAGRGDLLSPRPTSATSGCSRLVTAATSSTSIDRATTSCPNPTTTSRDRAGRCAICDQHPKMLSSGFSGINYALRGPGRR